VALLPLLQDFQRRSGLEHFQYFVLVALASAQGDHQLVRDILGSRQCLSGREDEEAQQQNQYSFSHFFSFSAADIYCRPDIRSAAPSGIPEVQSSPGVNTDERNYPQTSTEKSTKLVKI
jgi:hypothetical protein